MHWIDYVLVIIPVFIVLYIGLKCQKYVRGVTDFLAAGRVAGRYVIAVGDVASGLSVITIIALVEAKYQCGYGMSFWETLMLPISTALSLSGYCIYRYRATRALSIGQFLEMRYSRSFRVVAATIRTIAEMITNSIGPAVAANFFIYFLFNRFFSCLFLDNLFSFLLLYCFSSSLMSSRTGLIQSAQARFAMPQALSMGLSTSVSHTGSPSASFCFIFL